MLRSMFSAVSGLRSHQTMMDVTGNNVANVNTAGYKSTRTTFSETLTQITRGGAEGAAGAGGVNPMQLGLGSQVAATDVVLTQGASQVTGRATDVAIQGEGFFAVTDGTDTFYTRAGAFGIDNSGNLVNPEGMQVVDVNGAAIQVAAGTTDIAIGPDGMVRGKLDGASVDIGELGIAIIPNPGGMTRIGNGLYAEGPASGVPVLDAAGANGRGGVQSGTLEMSNVDLAQEFTNLILAQRGFQANSRTITASDELLQELVNLKR